MLLSAQDEIPLISSSSTLAQASTKLVNLLLPTLNTESASRKLSTSANRIYETIRPSRRCMSLEAILVDFQRVNLRFQRGPRDAQLGRSPLGSEYPAATFFQGGLNDFLLLRQESYGKLHLVFRFCQRRLLWKPAFVDREHLRFAKYDRALDDVLQFANVS